MAENTKPGKPKQEEQDERRARFVIQLAALLALVALGFIDAGSADFQVERIVYAIIAGIAFGVGGRDVINFILRR